MYQEGYDLKHCIYSYKDAIQSKLSYIFSMKKMLSSGSSKRQLTIELRNNYIIQIRGYKNRWPNSEELAMIKLWAAKYKLEMDSSYAQVNNVA